MDRKLVIILKDSSFYREKSDYDDFYIASKEETQQQVSNAEYIVGKIEKYILKETENMESDAENER